MSTRSLVQLILFVLFVYVGWLVAKPYVDNYRLTKVVENIAQYCTIHTVEETEKEFGNRIIDLGRKDIVPGSLRLDKDEETQSVKASLKYKDKIEVFGYLVKPLEFEIKAEAAKVDKII